jgi:hypothetical protein
VKNSANRKLEDVKLCRKKLDHFEHMRTSYEHVSKGKYPNSLQEIERKQNLGRGLTHVTDATFEFFLALERKRCSLHSIDLANAYKSTVFEHAYEVLQSDSALMSLFTCIFADFEQSDSDIITALYHSILQGYMCVGNNQFRKSLLVSLGKKKKFRHRAEICKSSKKVKLSEKVVAEKKNVVCTKSSQSACEKSRSSKKVKLSEKVHVLEEKTNVVCVKTSQGTSEKCRKKLKLSEVVEKTNVVCTTTSKTTSESADNTENNDVELHTQSDNSEEEAICPRCYVVYPNGQKQWISCESCNSWYHRNCAGLKTVRIWNIFNNTKKKWYCINCA